MIPLHSTIDGFGPLRDIEIDWQALGSGIIVGIDGPFGSGKTTLMEITSIGIVSLEMAYYEGAKIWDQVGANGAYMKQVTQMGPHLVTTIFECGANGKNRKATIQIDDEKVVGPKQGEYLEVAGRIFPAKEEMLIANFGAQGGIGNLFRLERAERIRAFARMFRLYRWKEWALEANRRAAACSSSLTSTKKAWEDATAMQARRNELRNTLAEEKTEAGRIEADWVAARRRQAEIGPEYLAENQKVSALESERNSVAESLLETRKEKEELDRKVSVLEAQIKELTPTEEVDGDALSKRLAEIREALAPLQAKKAEAEQTYERALQVEEAASTEVRRLENFLRTSEERHENALRSLKAEIRGLERIAAAVGEVDLEHPMCAKCPLTQEGGQAVSRIDKAQGELAEAEKTFETAKANVKVDLEAAEQNLKEARETTRQWALLASDIGTEISTLNTEQRNIGEKLAAESSRSRQQSLRDQAIGNLNAALDSRDVVGVRVDQLAKRMQGIRVDRSRLDDLRSETTMLETQLESFRITAQNSARRIAEIESHLAPLADIDKIVIDAERAWRNDERLAKGWKIVNIACDHVRTAEMDRIARPATEIATDILSFLDNGRLEVHLVTQTENSNGTMSEDFCPILVDRNDDGAIRKKGSGGETSFAAEALCSAVDIVMTEQAPPGRYPVKWAWRDESSTGQNDEAQEVYLTILRDLIRRAQLDKVILIAHQDIMQKTDRRIHLERGRIVGIS